MKKNTTFLNMLSMGILITSLLSSCGNEDNPKQNESIVTQEDGSIVNDTEIIGASEINATPQNLNDEAMNDIHDDYTTQPVDKEFPYKTTFVYHENPYRKTYQIPGWADMDLSERTESRNNVSLNFWEDSGYDYDACKEGFREAFEAKYPEYKIDFIRGINSAPYWSVNYAYLKDGVLEGYYNAYAYYVHFDKSARPNGSYIYDPENNRFFEFEDRIDLRLATLMNEQLETCQVQFMTLGTIVMHDYDYVFVDEAEPLESVLDCFMAIYDKEYMEVLPDSVDEVRRFVNSENIKFEVIDKKEDWTVYHEELKKVFAPFEVPDI